MYYFALFVLLDVDIEYVQALLCFRSQGLAPDEMLFLDLYM